MNNRLSPQETRDRVERFTSIVNELTRRQTAARCQGSLLEFVKHFWYVLEPETELVIGWPLEAMCLHLEAVTDGRIKRLLINISPGSMKSMLVNVFWPAWEWIRYPSYRYVTFSYAAHLTERDNNRFVRLLGSEQYKQLYSDKFKLVKVGEKMISNDKTGWKVASSVGGMGTGERGDRVILDDPHNVKQRESERVRTDTVDWFASAMSNRLNDLDKGAIVVIMQRVHQEDVSGFILDKGLGYVHLMIPAEYEPERHCETDIGWSDPRKEAGELFWENRISRKALSDELSRMGPFDYAGQYQQRPVPKGGAIFKDEWWQYYEMPYHGRFPMTFEYILASLDTAYTQRETNDYSALTVWGVFRNADDEPKVMLIDAWQKRLPLHGSTFEVLPDENEENRRVRQSSEWGLVEWVAYSCKKHKVDRLLIEAKASGLTVADEIRRLYSNEGWGVELYDPRSDKVARAHSVVPLFSDWFIFVPASADSDNLLVPYEFADDVIRQAEVFPRGSHDDLVDTMTQALRHIRQMGLGIRREEYKRDQDEALRYRPPQQPLYQV